LDDSQKLLTMGLFQTIYSIGMIAGPAITGFVIQNGNGGFGVPFALLTGIALVGAALSYARYPRYPLSGAQ
jgi:MFS family permease